MSEVTKKKMSEWLKEKNDSTEQSNGMKLLRTVAALLILILAIVVAVKVGWMSGLVLAVVAVSMIVNAWTNNDVLEFACDLATPGAFILFIGMLLYYTPNEPTPVAPLPGNIPAPTDNPQPKTEVEKLKALVGAKVVDSVPEFTDAVYAKVTRKGNVVTCVPLEDGKWALLTDPKTAVLVEKGSANVTEVDGKLVYSSPNDVANFRIFFIPSAAGLRPSGSRPLPADSK